MYRIERTFPYMDGAHYQAFHNDEPITPYKTTWKFVARRHARRHARGWRYVRPPSEWVSNDGMRWAAGGDER